MKGKKLPELWHEPQGVTSLPHKEEEEEEEEEEKLQETSRQRVRGFPRAMVLGNHGIMVALEDHGIVAVPWDHCVPAVLGPGQVGTASIR